MVLEALNDYYNTLLKQGRISRPGWSDTKISYAICLKESGEVEKIISVKDENDRPIHMELPTGPKRSNALAPCFMWDNATYMLGLDIKGKPERAINCFQACKNHYKTILDGVVSPAAFALRVFFSNWNPETAKENPLLSDCLDDLLKGRNLTFMVDGKYISEDPAFCKAWDDYYMGNDGGEERICLVTGKKAPAQLTHPAIKGLAGAQPSGATLVSFNGASFCHYGQEQSMNAPVSKQAAFAYTSAINAMLADKNQSWRMGHDTMLFWAKDGNPAYQKLFIQTFLKRDKPDEGGDEAVEDTVVDETGETSIDPDMEFFILMLSPNAGRVAVRFFLRDKFGIFMRNIVAHNERMSLRLPNGELTEPVPITSFLYALANPASRDKVVPPLMESAIVEAVLTNQPYPSLVQDYVLHRTITEKSLTWKRAAIIKAYMLQNYKDRPNYSNVLEVASVGLNESCNSQPYVLGRIFAVMDRIHAVSGDFKLTTTIKDRYIIEAATSPRYTFNKLERLNAANLKKLRTSGKFGYAKVMEDIINDLYSKMDGPTPEHFGVAQQDKFFLGFHHQQAYNAAKSNERNAENCDNNENNTDNYTEEDTTNG